jgi:hypothetical protein
MLALAESHHDEKTLSAVREHLAPSSDSEEAMMQAGLDALYGRHDPADAVARFRAIPTGGNGSVGGGGERPSSDVMSSRPRKGR